MMKIKYFMVSEYRISLGQDEDKLTSNSSLIGTVLIRS